MPPTSLVVRLKAIHAWNRWRLARIRRRHPGLVIDPAAGSNLAVARFGLEPGARLQIGARVATERRPGALSFLIAAGAEVSIGDDVWLRTEIEPVTLVAGPGARIEIGPESFLNGCYLSANRGIALGRRVFVGFGSRLIDAGQHDLDDTRPDRAAPIRVGDHVWIAADVGVLPGVEIGAHSVVGTRSLVTRDVPPHTLAFGHPAEPRGPIGDRSSTR